MEIKALDFFLGLTLGAVLGVGLTLAVIKVRGWLGHSEAGRLKSENRSLKTTPGGERPPHRPDAHRNRAPGGAAGAREGSVGQGSGTVRSDAGCVPRTDDSPFNTGRPLHITPQEELWPEKTISVTGALVGAVAGWVAEVAMQELTGHHITTGLLELLGAVAGLWRLDRRLCGP